MWSLHFTSTSNYGYTAGFLEHESYNEIYMVRDDPVVFLNLFGTDEKLIEDADNPLARALERAGTGWLVGAWKTSPDYCAGIGTDIGCQAIGIAASTGSDSSVEANCVVLFDSKENAANSEAKYPRTI